MAEAELSEEEEEEKSLEKKEKEVEKSLEKEEEKRHVDEDQVGGPQYVRFKNRSMLNKYWYNTDTIMLIGYC